MTSTAIDIAAEASESRGTGITLSGVTKDFGLAKPAVDDISLRIEPGEFMTLLGPSGSGKTTTLNLIAGFESLTSGTIEIDGVDVGALPAHKRNLGMLFQNYALFPHMTVAQNVAYPLRARRVDKETIRRLVRDVLELVQLTGRDGDYPAQLSGGQQQRVALARAVVFNPKALLLDEPLSALDRNLRAALQAEIRRIHHEVGSTFVFVTHDQEEAMSLSDRIALFREGRIEQIGSPQQLYSAPESLFTARFLGDSNVFALDEPPRSGTATWQGTRWRVDAGTVAAHPGVREHAALVVRPEGLGIAQSATDVPAGMNSVRGRVRDIEYLGSYRSVQLTLGADVPGRAKIDPVEQSVEVGDDVVVWWHPERQRVVAA